MAAFRALLSPSLIALRILIVVGAVLTVVTPPESAGRLRFELAGDYVVMRDAVSTAPRSLAPRTLQPNLIARLALTALSLSLL